MFASVVFRARKSLSQAIVHEFRSFHGVAIVLRRSRALLYSLLCSR